jgi:membrane-associated phospholipid phosphatase
MRELIEEVCRRQGFKPPVICTLEMLRAGLFAFTLLCAPSALASAPPCESSLPWSRLGQSAENYVKPGPLLLTAGAITAPFIMVPTNADHELRVFSQRELGGRYDAESISYIAPYLIMASMVTSHVALQIGDGSCRATRATAAAIQATSLTMAAVSLLKVATGRGWPNSGGDPRAADRLSHPENAKDFEPFSGLDKIAWPSGHTAVSFAAAAAVRASMPRDSFARYLLYPIAVGVGVGMVWNDHHWSSDVVSGALLGEAIGGAVGRAFAPTKSRALANVMLLPMAGTTQGAMIFGTF